MTSNPIAEEPTVPNASQVPNTTVASTNPSTKSNIFPKLSPGLENAWLEVSDDYLIIFELLENATLFSTSAQYKYEGITRPGAAWERLVLCQNKQSSGFSFLNLEKCLRTILIVAGE